MRSLVFTLLLLCGTPSFGQSLFEPITKLDPIPFDRWTSNPQTFVEDTFAPLTPNATPARVSPTKRLERNANGTFWEWSRPAWYHKAAYAVTIGGQSGSGVLIKTADPRKFALLTNAHVVCRVGQGGYVQAPSRTVSITRSDGSHKTTGRFLSATAPRIGSHESQADYQQDIAIYLVEGDGLVGLPISNKLPPVGTKVDVMGFGGPLYGSFRPFSATYIDEGSAPITLDAPSISGDSGSGMVWDGAVIGLNFGAFKAVETTAGFMTREGVKGQPLVWPASAAHSPSFLANYVQQICGPMGCPPVIVQPDGFGEPAPPGIGQAPPGIGRAPGGQFPGPEQFYPPAGWQNQPPQTRPAAPYSPPPGLKPSQPPAQYPPGYGLKCPGCGVVTCPCCGKKAEESNSPEPPPVEKSIDIEAEIAAQVRKYLDANMDKLRGRDGVDAVVSDDIKQALANLAANSVINSEALGERIKAETAGDMQSLRSAIPTVEAIVASLPPIKVEYLGKGDEVARTEIIDLSSGSPTLRIPPVKLIQEREDGMYSIEKPLGEPAKIGVSGRVQSSK